MALTFSVARESTVPSFSKSPKDDINKRDASDVAITPPPVPAAEPGAGEVIDHACDLSTSYFRFTYNYEHSEKDTEDLTNWLSLVLPIAKIRAWHFRDQEIIIYNGAIIEAVIDSILLKYPIRGLRTIVGLSGSYMITVVSRLHDGGRGVGDTISGRVIEVVRKDLCILRGTHTDIELIDEASDEVKELVVNVGGGGNILHCNHVDKLHVIVKQITGHSASSVLKKLEGRTRIGKEPDMSYIPSYLQIVRKMQGIDPFPTFLGEVHYSDSATKGMLDCALQIDGSDFQSEYVEGVDIKVNKRTNKLREVHLLSYDCTLEEMLRISRKDDLDKEQRAAVLQTALIKAQRAHVDTRCLLDLLNSPPQTVEQVQNLANQFRDRAREHWKEALGSFTYEPFDADEDFLCTILDSVDAYSVIPTLRDDLNANRSYYKEQIEKIQQDLKQFGNVVVDRVLLTTKAILANRVTFVLRRSGRAVSIEKFLAGNKVDDTQWHVPIQAIMGIVTAHARTGARITINQSAIEAVYRKMAATPSIPSVIGPLLISQEMIVPHLFDEFARQRFTGRQARTAPKKLLDEFKRNRGEIIVDEINLKYLTDDALTTISGEATIGLGMDVSRAHRELHAADGAYQLERYTVNERSTGANASSSSQSGAQGGSGGSGGAKGSGGSGRKPSRKRGRH